VQAKLHIISVCAPFSSPISRARPGTITVTIYRVVVEKERLTTGEDILEAYGALKDVRYNDDEAGSNPESPTC